jgi:transposase
VLLETENLAGAFESLPPVGHGRDRQAAHYYRAQHARALQREKHWKEKRQAAEKIIGQLLVLVGWLLQRISELSRQLAWLKKQQFGRKSETQNSRLSAESEMAAALGAGQQRATDCAATKETAEGAGPEQRRRRRGQQPGAKGPKRKERGDLPEQIVHHTLEEAQLICAGCGKVRPELALTEQSQEIGWEVRLVRRRHVRFRYGPSCDCPQGGGIITAPKAVKLIAKGLFAVDFWVQVLLKKFEFQQPIQRTVRELQAHGLHVSPGTLSGGLQKIAPMVQALAGQFVLHSRQAAHWHMDETRWPMFCLQEGKGRSLWWFWVVVSPEVTAFLLEPTRSGQVPKDFFPKGAEGIVNVDRYGGYFGLLGPDWSLKLAYCWAHQRRDFINLAESSKPWAQGWVDLINQLFKTNGQRRQAWFKKQSDLFAPLDLEVRRQIKELQERLDLELGNGPLGLEREKILRSMKRHWAGLTVFVEHPYVPMDNNAAERAGRPLAVARKNFYGSGSEWSGELACACFTLLATLRQHRLCPRKYFQAYLEACAGHGGRAPEQLEEFLPWKWSAEKRAAFQVKERPP